VQVASSARGEHSAHCAHVQLGERWLQLPPAVHPGESNANSVALGFKAAGLRRLDIYRAAVQAGFHIDWPRG